MKKVGASEVLAKENAVSELSDAILRAVDSPVLRVRDDAGIAHQPFRLTIRALGIVDISGEVSAQEPIGPIVFVNHPCRVRGLREDKSGQFHQSSIKEGLPKVNLSEQSSLYSRIIGLPVFPLALETRLHLGKVGISSPYLLAYNAVGQRCRITRITVQLY
jgi:hypothetical protein